MTNILLSKKDVRDKLTCFIMNSIDKDGNYIGYKLYEFIDKIIIELNKKLSIKKYIINFFTIPDYISYENVTDNSFIYIPIEFSDIKLVGKGGKVVTHFFKKISKIDYIKDNVDSDTRIFLEQNVNIEKLNDYDTYIKYSYKDLEKVNELLQKFIDPLNPSYMIYYYKEYNSIFKSLNDQIMTDINNYLNSDSDILLIINDMFNYIYTKASFFESFSTYNNYYFSIIKIPDIYKDTADFVIVNPYNTSKSILEYNNKENLYFKFENIIYNQQVNFNIENYLFSYRYIYDDFKDILNNGILQTLFSSTFNISLYELISLPPRNSKSLPLFKLSCYEIDKESKKKIPSLYRSELLDIANVNDIRLKSLETLFVSNKISDNLYQSSFISLIADLFKMANDLNPSQPNKIIKRCNRLWYLLNIYICIRDYIVTTLTSFIKNLNIDFNNLTTLYNYLSRDNQLINIFNICFDSKIYKRGSDILESFTPSYLLNLFIEMKNFEELFKNDIMKDIIYIFTNIKDRCLQKSNSVSEQLALNFAKLLKFPEKLYMITDTNIFFNFLLKIKSIYNPELTSNNNYITLNKGYELSFNNDVSFDHKYLLYKNTYLWLELTNKIKILLKDDLDIDSDSIFYKGGLIFFNYLNLNINLLDSKLSRSFLNLELNRDILNNILELYNQDVFISYNIDATLFINNPYINSTYILEYINKLSIFNDISNPNFIKYKNWELINNASFNEMFYINKSSKCNDNNCYMFNYTDNNTLKIEIITYNSNCDYYIINNVVKFNIFTLNDYNNMFKSVPISNLNLYKILSIILYRLRFENIITDLEFQFLDCLCNIMPFITLEDKELPKKFKVNIIRLYIYLLLINNYLIEDIINDFNMYLDDLDSKISLNIKSNKFELSYITKIIPTFNIFNIKNSINNDLINFFIDIINYDKNTIENDLFGNISEDGFIDKNIKCKISS
jgi:hypothetical protein